MRKIAYIIPGYGGTKNDKNIDRLVAEHGFEPVFVMIDWDRASPTKFKYFVDDFLKIYKKPARSKTIVIGFSFGAMIAILAAKKIKMNALVLCSISPYFKEDQASLSVDDIKFWKETFVEDFLSFDSYAKSIRTKTYITVGTKELKSMKPRAKDASQKIRGSRLISIRGVGHNIRQKPYMKALDRILGEVVPQV